MENNTFFEEAKRICSKFYRDFELAPHSTFKIGGKADFSAFPQNEKELVSLIALARENDVSWHVFGNCSNVLFESAGVEGLVIFTNGLTTVETEGEKIRCGSGFSLTSLSLFAAKNSLSDLEFAYGIPGTVGGAVYMNAGAYGGEISNIITESTCLCPETGEIVKLTAKEHEFSYRNSIFHKNRTVILSSEFKLQKGEKAAIEAIMRENMEKRKFKQPLSFPNAGSTFKRPQGAFAGKLIEDAGLKGFSVGGAQVSEKHAGFVINTGNATSTDVLALTDKIKQEVFSKFGIKLELEIIYVK